MMISADYYARVEQLYIAEVKQQKNNLRWALNSVRQTDTVEKWNAVKKISKLFG